MLDCMPEGLCEKLRVCVRCVYVHARGTWVYVSVATVELCSNCTKLRISVGDELGDLQYNCAALSPHVPACPGVRAAAAPKELQPRSRYVLTRRVCTYLQCALRANLCASVCMDV